MADKVVTYSVASMRVTFPNGKVAAKNADRFATISGVFSDVKGNRLSIVSKNVTLDEARDPDTIIDPENGVLSLPAGQRGRKPVAGADTDTITAALNALRGV